MDISVIIPTRLRPDKLARCVRALSRQQLPGSHGLSGRFEVIVSIDGEDDEQSEHAAITAWDHDAPHPMRIVHGEQAGPNAARNRAIELARGRWTILINDDLYAQPGLLCKHIESHLESHQNDRFRANGAIVLGDAPWYVHADDSLFDRVVRETSIVFFYDRMTDLSASGTAGESGHWHDWGFRHCYTLNLSMPTAALRAVGGFTVLPVVYGYDDIEAGWRLQQQLRMPVLYRPLAKGTHDHRYSPDEYLKREHTLGRAAWHLAHAAPACALAIFGRDIASASEIDYSREFVAREQSAADRLRASFIELARTPSAAITGPASKRLVNLVYEQHLLLKRWEWRRGLLDAARSSIALSGDPLRAFVAA